jgi:hypothetical protein
MLPAFISRWDANALKARVAFGTAFESSGGFLLKLPGFDPTACRPSLSIHNSSADLLPLYQEISIPTHGVSTFSASLIRDN